MKTYIKPNTEMHSIELTQMIAESPQQQLKTGTATEWGAKENETTISSPSLWDEEE